MVRLKLRDAQIVEIEQFMVRDPVPTTVTKRSARPSRSGSKPFRPRPRASRGKRSKPCRGCIPDARANDGAGIYPFTGDCDRLELGRQSVARETNESYGHADSAVEFTTLKARAQYALGMMGYINCVRDRRVLVSTPSGAPCSAPPSSTWTA